VLAGAVHVFHGTNFVLPPAVRAGGVLTVHDLAYLRHADTVSRTSLAYRELVPRGLRRAAVVLTPSQSVADELAAQYPEAADRVRAAPLGVDPAWSSARPLTASERAGLGVPADYLLFVGTREPRKNLPVLLAAHRRARAQAGDGVPALVLAGPAGWAADGDVDGRPGGQDDVVRCGYLPGPTLRSLVAGASALVLPSRYEGFGLPVLEALACGVPVVCSDLPVLREVGGALCRYVPVGDVDALAAALTGLPGRSPVDAAGRRARAATFTWEACAATTARAYRDAAAA
jgi:glycosyltransferase involved in cell wall biosynthesis